MNAFTELNRLPVVRRCMIFGALIGCLAGGIVGLIVGLRAYVPTAWFAVIEVGIPAGLLGGVFGAIVGASLWAFRKALHRSAS